MGLEQEWDVFLPFGEVKETADIMNEDGVGWEDFFAYVAGKGYIRAWPCQDIGGKPLDPRNPEDYQKLDAPNVRLVISLLADKVSGDGDAGE